MLDIQIPQVPIAFSCGKIIICQPMGSDPGHAIGNDKRRVHHGNRFGKFRLQLCRYLRMAAHWYQFDALIQRQLLDGR
ncbi:hypothetical protein [Janthinobacterium sp.]|uniref:hypothetical protein n=1 Tax=Janthinobacterium sp. TaxID=1871054 RepID=UPI002588A9FC|nr:hypothetical protein [Janthinobacterium sp.]MCX7289715.1 hypothetical protein [Janthinobacterium sp.]